MSPPSQDYSHPDDHNLRTYDMTPTFKTFSVFRVLPATIRAERPTPRWAQLKMKRLKAKKKVTTGGYYPKRTTLIYWCNGVFPDRSCLGWNFPQIPTGALLINQSQALQNSHVNRNSNFSGK